MFRNINGKQMPLHLGECWWWTSRWSITKVIVNAIKVWVVATISRALKVMVMFYFRRRGRRGRIGALVNILGRAVGETVLGL